MYCKYCGEQIGEQDAFCKRCGKSTTDDTAITKKQEDNEISNQSKAENAQTNSSNAINNAQKYRKRVFKINLFELCSHILTVFILISIIFLPIYKCNYEPTLEDIGSFEDLGEALEKGYIEKNFSLFDDLSFAIEAFTDNEEKNNSSEIQDDMSFFGNISIIYDELFAILEVVFAVLLLFITAKKIYENSKGLYDINNGTLLKYDEIKKSGQVQEKPNFFQKQTVFTVVIYAIFDIVFTQMFPMSQMMLGEGVFYRYMFDFSGLSGYVIIVAALIIGVIIMNAFKNKEEKEMRLSIAKE